MADPQGFQLDDVVRHPEFQELSLPDKNAFLMQHVPEFSQAAPKDRSELLNTIHYSSGSHAMTVPSTGPGEERKPALAREGALGVLGTVAPETEHPLTDLAKSGLHQIGIGPLSPTEARHPIISRATEIVNTLTPGYRIMESGLGLVKQVLGAAGEIFPIIPKLAPGGGGGSTITPEEQETAAHGLGTIGGLAGMAAVPEIMEKGPALAKRMWGEPIATPSIPPGLSPEATIRLASPEARTGVIKVSKTAVPSSGNVDFLEKAAIAAPDLAKIERAHPLSKSGSAGGIIRPDYRVRQTVTNIDTHLDDLWNSDRKPLIEKNATATVDTVPGLSQLSEGTLKGVSRKMKGQLPPTDRTLTLQQTDDLLHGVNAYLRTVEGKTPEAQSIARATNPDIDALYDLKHSLRQAIGKTLERQGVPRGTLDDFDMRYGALSEVRDQLRTQMNPVEAERFIDRLVGYAGLKGMGLKGIKTVEVSPGRTLQKGMESLARSPLSPDVERAARQVQTPLRPALPPAPESATIEPSARIIGTTRPTEGMVEEAYPVRPGIERLGTGLRAPEQIPVGPSPIGNRGLIGTGESWVSGGSQPRTPGRVVSAEVIHPTPTGQAEESLQPQRLLSGGQGTILPPEVPLAPPKPPAEPITPVAAAPAATPTSEQAPVSGKVAQTAQEPPTEPPSAKESVSDRRGKGRLDVTKLSDSDLQGKVTELFTKNRDTSEGITPMEKRILEEGQRELEKRGVNPQPKAETSGLPDKAKPAEASAPPPKPETPATEAKVQTPKPRKASSRTERIEGTGEIARQKSKPKK